MQLGVLNASVFMKKGRDIVSSQIDYVAMRFWWDIAQTIFLVVMAIYVWIKSRSQVNSDRIEIVENKLSDIDKRLVKAISHDDLEDIHKRLNGISRDLSKVEGEFKSNNRLLHSIDDFLRSQGSSK